MSQATRHTLLDAPLLRDPDADSLQRQLHQRIRQAILAGQLLPGSRLPGSRALADTLAVSRNTVLAAYEQLVAEGFLQPDRRGTRVAELPRPAAQPVPQAVPNIAKRLQQIQPASAPARESAAFRPGIPALAQFPLAAWRQAQDRILRNAGSAVLGYGDPFGEPVLRNAIAQHLALNRGIRCDAQQIVITEGAQQALKLCTALLSNPGDTAWVEDPGYRGAKTAFRGADLQLQPMPVDEDGMQASAEDWQTRTPRLIYTTPSHQYPSGAVLSVSRRLALIAAARQYGAWIIEDDYDSEFRHSGEPIVAMQGLIEQAPVLYVGTFSKTMFPALRLGFLVLPPQLLAAVQPSLMEMQRGGNRLQQRVLADFIDSGQYGRHLGRMRRLYRERQHALRQAIQEQLTMPHHIDGGHCGLHLTVRLPHDYPDRAIAAAARRYDMAPQALSGFAIVPGEHSNGLVLGYGNTPADRYPALLRTLNGLIMAGGESMPA